MIGIGIDMLTYLKKFLWVLPFLSFVAGYLILLKIYPNKEIDTPPIVGKSLGQGCAILAAHSLNSRLVSVKEDPLLPDGTIISQTPLARQKIKPNQTVFVVISALPQKNVAPTYVKKAITEIEQECKSAGIRAQLYSMPSSSTHDICIAQWPEAGSIIENNKMVLYSSQEAKKPIIIPNVKNKNGADVIAFLKKNNIMVQVIHEKNDLEENHTCDNCVVIDQRPLAGSIALMDDKKPLLMQLHIKAQE